MKVMGCCRAGPLDSTPCKLDEYKRNTNHETNHNYYKYRVT